MPTHQVGDLLVTFAYRDGSATAPTLAAGWTSIQSGGANTNSAIAAYKFATSTTDGSDTWTNATEVVAVIYRGTSPLLPIGNSVQNGAASTVIDYPADTLASVAGTSWVVGFAGHRSTNVSITTPPTGMTNLAGGNGAAASAAAADTNAPVSSWSDQTVNVGGTSSGWRSMVIEILAPTTTLFLHQTTTISHPNSINTGSLSTALPAGTNHSPTATTAMDMDSTMGSSQTSRTSTTGTSAVLTSARVGTWVSNPLNVSTINAQNWTVGFGYQENNANANQFMAFSIYVLKSDGTVRGYIYDSATALSTEFTTAEQGRAATVAGSAVSGIQNTDQLCIEIWATGTQTLTTSRTITYYWDGGTIVSDGVATSDAGAYVHTGAQAIAFSTNTSPTVALNSPTDSSTSTTTTPMLNFTGTDANSDTISYEVEVDTVNTFNSHIGTPSYVQTATSGSSAGSAVNSQSVNITPTAGNTLILAIGCQAGLTITGISDTVNGSWPAAIISSIWNSSISQSLLYYYPNTAAGPLTITVNLSGNSQNFYVDVSEFSGILSANAVDGSATANVANSTSGTNNATAATYTSSVDGDLIFAWGNYLEGPLVAGTGYTNISGGHASAEYTVQSTHGSITPTFTDQFGSGDGYDILVAGFKASSTQPLINAFSATGGHDAANFVDVTHGADTDPFASGDQIAFTVPAGEALADTTTYYWRVRGIDPSGSNIWGNWSSTYSFTVNTSVPPNTPTLSSPSNAGTVSSITPVLTFTDTDNNNNNLSYEVEVDTVNTFNSQSGAITRDTTNVPTTNPFTSTGNFSTTRTSGSFSPQANSAIFVVLGFADNGGGTPAATVTDNHSNTYTLLKASAASAANLIGIYWCYYSSAPGSTTVSAHATANSSNGGMFEVLNYLGVSPTQTGNTVSVTRTTAGVLQGSLTVASGNIVIGGGTDWASSNALTTLANSTSAGGFQDTSNGDSYNSFTSTTTGTNTYGYSTSTKGGFAAVEVQAAGGSPLIDVLSSANAGFADVTNPSDTDPFASGDTITYTVQAGNALTNSTTYYWRVRAIDPSGSNTWSSWSSIYSFTVNVSTAMAANFFYLFSDLL